MRQLLLLAGLLLTLAGCAAPQTRVLLAGPTAPALAAPTELTLVPFHPQTLHQCGPAALASVLQYRGVLVSPDTLATQVFVPGREGSLAIEMQAAPRRYGRVAYRVPPRVDALLEQVAQGRPVLVLQNLGLSFSPRWHYAVLIGYDLGRREVLLRSGVTERERLSLDTFEHTWARGDYWGVVVEQPETIPDFVTLAEAQRQALALERTARHAAARALYAAIVARWPEASTARFGLGNMAYQLEDRAAAEAAWLPLLDLPDPQYPWFHNLIELYAEQGRTARAKALLATARQRFPHDARLNELAARLLPGGPPQAN